MTEYASIVQHHSEGKVELFLSKWVASRGVAFWSDNWIEACPKAQHLYWLGLTFRPRSARGPEKFGKYIQPHSLAHGPGNKKNKKQIQHNEDSSLVARRRYFLRRKLLFLGNSIIALRNRAIELGLPWHLFKTECSFLPFLQLSE